MATKQTQPHLLLHSLMVSLSYWGSAVRVMLFAILFSFTQWIAATQGYGSLPAYSVQFIYVVGIFVMFDTGYVTIARALPFRREVYDQVLFLVLLALYALCMIVPYYIELPLNVRENAEWVFLSPLFLLALRLVLGLMYGQYKRD